jgi:hypothetical protein
VDTWLSIQGFDENADPVEKAARTQTARRITMLGFRKFFT